MRLIEGAPTKKVMQKCISCYACNAFCPHNCKPYELITKRWFERYLESGLPVRASYMMPLTLPDFRVDMIERMNHREQEMLKKWAETPPEGEVVLYPGCNLMALPHLVDAGFMKEVVISGDWELCCGEMFYRTGLYNVVERIAEKLSSYYGGNKIGKMLFACPACLNMFSNVLPKQFGARFDFKIEYLGEFLLDKIDSGEIEIKKKLNKTVALHDSCHGRILGDLLMDSTRKLLSLTGLEIKEINRSRLEGLCCGLAAGANRYSPLDMYFAGAKELWQAKKSRAEELALYCGGCNISLTLLHWLFPTGQPVRHLLEYLKEATGEKVYHPTRKRSLHMLFNIIANSFPNILSSRSYRY